jgi:hypothetical protein
MRAPPAEAGSTDDGVESNRVLQASVNLFFKPGLHSLSVNLSMAARRL